LFLIPPSKKQRFFVWSTPGRKASHLRPPHEPIVFAADQTSRDH